MKDLHRKSLPTVEESLASIDQTLKRIDMALMHQAGVGAITTVIPEEGGGVILGFTFNDEAPAPPEMRRAGTTKTLPGTTVFEFIPPPPYTGVVIICALDDDAPLGMRCYAEVNAAGRERKRYPMPIVTEE